MNDLNSALALASLLFIAGCVDPGTMPTDPDPAGAASPIEPGGIKSERTMEHDKNMAAGTIELPVTVLAPAIADLAARLKADKGDIEVLRALPVIWSDGSLGCPKPDMAYTQSLVPGQWVILGHAGKRYSYHSGRSGRLRLCKTARPTLTGPPPHGHYNDAV